MNKFIRFESMIGKNEFIELQNKHVLIAGLGGVGGNVFLSLVRLGIIKFTICDFDVFDESNLNRQILSTISSIGRSKVDVAIETAATINDSVVIKAINNKLNKEVINSLDTSIDYIIDCIDDVDAKIELYRFARKNNIKIISSMGTAMKFDPLKLKVSTLNATSYDPLAKRIRFLLKDEKDLLTTKVIYSTEEVSKELKIKHQELGFLPSNVIVPNACGNLICKEVLFDLLGK